MKYASEIGFMGVFTRILFILMLFVIITASGVLLAIGWAIPDPEGILWVAIAWFLFVMAFVMVAIDHQNPYGIL